MREGGQFTSKLTESEREAAPGADDGQGFECVAEPRVGQSLHLCSELEPGVPFSGTQEAYDTHRHAITLGLQTDG